MDISVDSRLMLVGSSFFFVMHESSWLHWARRRFKLFFVLRSYFCWPFDVMNTFYTQHTNNWQQLRESVCVCVKWRGIMKIHWMNGAPSTCSARELSIYLNKFGGFFWPVVFFSFFFFFFSLHFRNNIQLLFEIKMIQNTFWFEFFSKNFWWFM